MGEVEPRPPPKAPPSPLVLVLPISIGLTALVLVAALHAALGNPLGVGWGAEVWSMVKSAVWPTIACASIGAYVRAQALTAGAARALPPPVHYVEVPRRLSTGGHRVIQVGQGEGAHGGGSGRRARKREEDDAS